MTATVDTSSNERADERANERATGATNGDEPLESIIDEAIACSDGDAVSLRDLLRAWGDRSYGPLFILLGFFAGTPLAAIPMVAGAVGAVISLLAVQMLIGKTHPWLPGFALDRSIDKDKLRKTREKTTGLLKFLDGLITERLSWAAGAPMRRVAAFIVFALGLLMIPFDAVPMAVAAPAWTVVLFGVAITARDGLVMLLAILACAGIAFMGYRIFA